ncbi:THO complex subunit 7/Mft1 [Phaffia rhodozyma]|uniref:THO complex subunit 7/Mft1 n=1 Tax=Phaffia rhodozyma TaxID=264483 RepID=A0A0F7SP00_PHARH|nr:THO complex subunit 7/Mft1 [Phaffia rhodozyma]
MEASISTLPPIKLKPLTVAQEDRIIESRLSNDERGIRKTLKNILTLERRSNQSTIEKDVDMEASSSENPAAKLRGTLSVEDKNTEAYSVFNVELKNLELHVKKAGIVGRMEAKMRETYAAKGKEIERKRPQHTLEIASLRERLQSAEEERKQKMEYDDVAQKILAVGKRNDLETAIQERQESLASLIAQRQAVLRSLRLRSIALGKVLQDLTQVEEVAPETKGPEDDEVDTEVLEAEKMLVEDAPKGDASDIALNDGEDQEEEDDDGTGKRREVERLPSPTADDIQMVEDVLPSEEPQETGESNSQSNPSNLVLNPSSPVSSALSNSLVSSPGVPSIADPSFAATSVYNTEISPSLTPSPSPSQLEDDFETSETTRIVPTSPTNSNISVTSTSSSTIIMISNSQLRTTRAPRINNPSSSAETEPTVSGTETQARRTKLNTPSVDQLASADLSIKNDIEDAEPELVQPEQEEPQLFTSSGRPKRRSLAASADVSSLSAPQTKKAKTRR